MSRRILVADDDREIVRLVRACLERAGLTVSVTYDGQEALFVARQSKPDLIIPDLTMPKIDGWDVHCVL